ncbi:ABC transporter ATP-binding protein [Vibrio sp. CDRSL-10 TSBA]
MSLKQSWLLMIKLQNLTKYYPSELGKQYVFKDINFTLPEGHNVALLGSNGAGKSTLFRIIAGSEYPNTGKVVTDKAISWPVALATGIHPQMTGRENTRFIGRVNGVANLDEYEEKVKRFAELGVKYDLLVKNYSSGMRSRLAFGCCIAIDFDVYLIDEATSVGDQKFRKKAKQALLDKSKTASVIMVSHDMKEIREFCDSAIILHQGTLTFYDDLERALKVYEEL